MRIRVLAVVAVALMFALSQTFEVGFFKAGHTSALAATIDGQRAASAVQADDNDNTSASSNNDNSVADNGNDNDAVADDNGNDNDAVADDNGNDNDAVADDNGNDNDSSASATNASAAAPTFTDESLKQPLAAASGTSNGSDVMIATPGERVAVRMFPWMPAGVQVTIRPVDPNTTQNVPGNRAGDLTFVVEARDANGMQLSSLPSEVNLAVRYADETVSNLNEGNLRLAWFNPTTNQWETAPKTVFEPDSNYVAASVAQLGTYTVFAP